MTENTDEEWVVIEPSSLSPEALAGLIEAFVAREGTDYGHQDYAFADKCRQVRAQVSRGDVCIVFDLQEETPNLVRRNDLPKR